VSQAGIPFGLTVADMQRLITELGYRTASADNWYRPAELSQRCQLKEKPENSPRGLAISRQGNGPWLWGQPVPGAGFWREPGEAHRPAARPYD